MGMLYQVDVAGELTTAQKTKLQQLLSELWEGGAGRLVSVNFQRYGHGKVEFAIHGVRKAANETELPDGAVVVGRE